MVLEESSTVTLDCQKDEQACHLFKQTSLKHHWRQMDKTKAVLLWAHPERAGLNGKDSNAGKKRRQQEERKNKCEMN